jgi:hypothetical protein
MTLKTQTSFWSALALVAFFGFQSSSQTVLLCDSFEQYNVGLLDTQSVVWNSWGSANEDSKVNTAFASSGTKSVRIYATGPNSQSDIVTELGNLSSGAYELEMSFYVNTSSSGYFNLMHEYNPSGTPSFGTWAVEVYLNGDTELGEINWGTASSGTQIDTFSILATTWNDLRFIIDLDVDSAWMWCNNNFVAQWKWSYGNAGVYQNWDAIDLYSAASPGTLASCWFDDICVTSIPTGTTSTSDCDDFESYTLGNLNSQSTDWNSYAGAPEDTEISDDEAQSGSYSMYVHDSGTNGLSDIVVEFDDLSSGVWEVSFSALVPSDRSGYFNLLHAYDEAIPNSTLWAVECFIDGSTDTASLLVGSAFSGWICDFEFESDDWNDLALVVDLDNDRGLIKADGDIIRAWPWSFGNTGDYQKFDAVNFYSASIGGLDAELYVDDGCIDSAVWNCPETAMASFTASVVGSGGLEWEFDAGNSDAFAYIWDFGDGNTAATFDPDINYTYMAEGQYTVQLRVMDKCMFEDSTDMNLQVIGLEEFDLRPFLVYPNPSQGNFTIDADLGASGALTVRVTDMKGQTVWSEVQREFTGQYLRTVDIELPSGVYIVQIQHDRGVRTKRLIVQ